MDLYTIYADHNKNINAKEFIEKMKPFLDGLVELDRMVSYRITRAKLGFRSMDLPEFRIDMNFNNMQQLDDAMTSIIRNEKSIDDKHVNFNKLVDVETIQHFLYRDYPDES
jgi:endo-1,4-beta-mannosidase